MKALTVLQPYASMLIDGAKWVENRTWGTSYRGHLVIHAGQGTRYLDEHESKLFPRGVAMGVVELVECVSLADVRSNPDDFCERLHRVGVDVEAFLAHEHAEGPICWIVRRPRRFKSWVSWRGAQGLFEYQGPLEFLA